MDKVFAELDRYDLMTLVIGTGGPGDYNCLKFDRYGKLNGFPNERWEWNMGNLETLNNEQLFILYSQIKEYKREGK